MNRKVVTISRVSFATLRRDREKLLSDERTGLLSVVGFKRRLLHIRKLRVAHAIALLDLRGFSKFNERRGGHLRGNELLKRFAALLGKSVHETDVVGRWGGDEFWVVLLGVTDRKILKRITERLSGPFSVEWGRRKCLLRAYVVAEIAADKPLDKVEETLHERLRVLKRMVKVRSCATSAVKHATSSGSLERKQSA